MFKYLRMDAYRLIKTKTLYVALGIILAAVAFSVYMMSTAAMPDLSATGGEGPSSMAIQNGKELGSFKWMFIVNRQYFIIDLSIQYLWDKSSTDSLALVSTAMSFRQYRRSCRLYCYYLHIWVLLF